MAQLEMCTRPRHVRDAGKRACFGRIRWWKRSRKKEKCGHLAGDKSIWWSSVNRGACTPLPTSLNILHREHPNGAGRGPCPTLYTIFPSDPRALPTHSSSTCRPNSSGPPAGIYNIICLKWGGGVPEVVLGGALEGGAVTQPANLAWKGGALTPC